MTDRRFIEIRELLDRIRYKQGWALSVTGRGTDVYLQWSFVGPCAKTGATQVHWCRKHRLSEFMTDGELVQTAFAAALMAEEHECREFFTYDGHRVFNPHLSLEALVSRAHMEGART